MKNKGYCPLVALAVVTVLLVLLPHSHSQGFSSRCYRGQQDIVFLLDSSGSIGLQNWQTMLNFMRDLLQGLDLGINNTRVGVISFDHSPTDSFFLDTHVNKEDVLQAVHALPYTGGGTTIDSAIGRALDVQFSEENGDRQRNLAPDVIVILTDAQIESGGDAAMQVQRAKDRDMRLFAVGIGNVNEEVLASIGYSGTWFSATFDVLQSVISNLTSIRCLGDVDKNECVPSCQEDQEGCYREGSVQVCKCSYDWVSKYCFPSFPISGGGGGGNDSSNSVGDNGNNGGVGGGGVGGIGGSGGDGGGRGYLEGICYFANPRDDPWLNLTDTEEPPTLGPFIRQICPTFGPMAGGTDLFIWGNGFKKTGPRNDHPIVKVGNQNCSILLSNDTFIHCVNTPCDNETGSDVARAVTVEIGNTTSVSSVFTCKQNPEIIDLYPTELFIEGGTKLTVTGKNLQSVARPIMEITMVHNTENGTSNTLFPSLCQADSTMKMTCPFPKITLPKGFEIAQSNGTDTIDSNDSGGATGVRKKRSEPTIDDCSTLGEARKRKLCRPLPKRRKRDMDGDLRDSLTLDEEDRKRRRRPPKKETRRKRDMDGDLKDSLTLDEEDRKRKRRPPKKETRRKRDTNDDTYTNDFTDPAQQNKRTGKREVDLQELSKTGTLTIRKKRQSDSGPLNQEDVLTFYLGFKLDGVTEYTNISKTVLNKGVLYVYRNPDILFFEESDRIRKYDDRSYLKVKGENLHYGSCTGLDCGYEVRVGDEPCSIQDVTQNEIQCVAPSQRPGTSGNGFKGAVAVLVTIGNLEFWPGYLLYPEIVTTTTTPLATSTPRSSPLVTPVSNWRSIVLYLGCAMIVVLVLLMFIFFCCYDFFRGKEWYHHMRHAKKKTWPRRRINPGIPYRDQLPALFVNRVSPLVKQSKNVTIGTTTNKGKFGVVYAGWLTDDHNAAVNITAKALQNNSPTTPAVCRFLDDALLLQNTNHRNLLPLYGIVIQHSRLHVLMGRAEYGTLYEFISHRKVSRSQKYKFCLDVAQGMDYLSSKGVVHKDLAARNCYVDADLDVMVGDRGLATDLYPDHYFCFGPEKQSVPIRWAAIEVLNDGHYSTLSDVWSFGVLMWEIFSKGKLPYAERSKYLVRGHLNFGNRLLRPELATIECYTAMKSCWNPYPPNRPTFERLAIILNSMYVNSQGRKKKMKEDDPVYIGRATAYNASGIGSYKPAATTTTPPDTMGHGPGYYDTRGTYLIEVESDFDEEEEEEDLQIDEEQPPVYAQVHKSDKSNRPRHSVKMADYNRDSGVYAEVPKVPTPHVYYNDDQEGEDEPNYASVERQSPVGNEAEEFPVGNEGEDIPVENEARESPIPQGEYVDVIHSSQLGNDNHAFEN